MLRSTLCLRTLNLLILLGICATPQAHPLDPALLQIRQQANGYVDLRWSGSRDFVTQAKWHLPDVCVQYHPNKINYNEQKWSGHNRWRCNATLNAKSLHGLDALEGKPLIVDYRILGEPQAQPTVITVVNGAISLPRAEHSFFDAFSRFAKRGLIHIAQGVDHLLFVFCLLLLLRSKRMLVRAVTAFTLGHCLTLFLCAAKLLTFTAAWAESCIALSLVVLCRELLGKPNPSSWIRRYPGMMTFCFGLIHGMGFAAALTEIGLDTDQLMAQIAGFNVGVEIGQLMFIAFTVGLGYLLQRSSAPGLLVRLRAVRLLTYGCGIIATFWFFERLLTWLPPMV